MPRRAPHKPALGAMPEQLPAGGHGAEAPRHKPAPTISVVAPAKQESAALRSQRRPAASRPGPAHSDSLSIQPLDTQAEGLPDCPYLVPGLMWSRLPDPEGGPWVLCHHTSAPSSGALASPPRRRVMKCARHRVGVHPFVRLVQCSHVHPGPARKVRPAAGRYAPATPRAAKTSTTSL